jgi:hypothetical protein
MSTQPFLLRVIPRDKDDYGVALYQKQLHQNNNPKSPRRLVQVWGAPFHAIIDYLIETLKKAGYRATDLSRSPKTPFELDEGTGVRFGLLLLALKPLSKIERIETINSAIRSMPDEEVYYWFSKCTTAGAARRSQKALRILLSPE